MEFSVESFVFVLAVFLIFYFIRRRARAYFLLTASIIFIARLDCRSCVWVLVTSFIVYLFGLLEGVQVSENKPGRAKVTMTIGVVLCVLSLFVLKHVATWNFADKILSGIIMPIGFSYYIFQAIAYLVDVYKGKIKAEPNLLFFLLYMCFFPKFVSGPIETPEKLLPQIKKLNCVQMFENDRISIAFPTILYGVFMKVVVADRLAIYTKILFNNPQDFGSFWLFAGMIMYTLQIYCDFAGYSSIAVGVSRLVGLDLTQNFFAPYLSPDITTFWRRWHISLSTWLRDYLYIPLGGNRKGTTRKYINTMIVFLVCGLWHGAGLSFVIWGALHGIFSIADSLLSGKKKKMRNVTGIVVTFLCVSFAWVFFGAPSTKYALSFILGIFTNGAGSIPFAEQIAELGMTKMDLNLPIYALIVFGFDTLMLRKGLPIGDAMYKLSPIVRYIIEYLLILGIALLGIYGPGYNPSDYMYMNF